MKRKELEKLPVLLATTAIEAGKNKQTIGARVL